MTLKEYNSMTEEEQKNLFKEFAEEEKEVLDEALKKFVSTSKNNKAQEKWVSLSGLDGGAIRVSDIEYIETKGMGALVITSRIRNGEKIVFRTDDSPEEIVKKINGE